MHYSIIIPLFNCQKTIKKVLLSLQNQSYSRKNFEIICVDDRSTDNTVNIVNKFKNVKLIKLPRNGGNGKTKNIGVKHAKGEIVFFVDDHMYLDRNALKNLDKLFMKNSNISGICGYYESHKKEDGNVFRDIRRRTIYGKDGITKTISFSSFTPFSVTIGAFKKNLFSKFLFPEDFGKNSSEDIVFQIRHHYNGIKFLYSASVRGIHDHNLDFANTFKKLLIEIKGTGDLIYVFLSKKSKNTVSVRVSKLSSSFYDSRNIHIFLRC